MQINYYFILYSYKNIIILLIAKAFKIQINDSEFSFYLITQLIPKAYSPIINSLKIFVYSKCYSSTCIPIMKQNICYNTFI